MGVCDWVGVRSTAKKTFGEAFGAATVAGSAGLGFHNWPSGHIPQDTAPNPLLRIRSPAKKTFGEAFGAATGVSDHAVLQKCLWMHVDLTSIDELTNALSRSGSDGLNCVEGFSFGAAMELAVWVEDQKYTSSFVGEWSKRSRPLNEAMRLLRGGQSWEPQKVHELAWDGMRPIRSRQCISQQHIGWNRFLERFAAALKAAGFVNGWNQAMAGVLGEMADNVVQHSTLGSGKALNGIVGYSVSTRRMAFTVADSGIGAVQSLKDNPLYAQITNGREALELIARKKASRRAGQAQGNGFKDLFIKLAAMNGRVRLRSADGLFSMTGNLGGCVPVMKCLHAVEGFHVSVECEI